MFVLLLITYVLSSSVPENGWAPEAIKLSRPIMNAISKERLDADLYVPSYDYQFAQELVDFKREEWYSVKSNKSSPFPTVSNKNNTISINAYYVLDEPEMKYWKKYGYKFLFSYNKKFKLKNILNVGKNCYEPFQCSKTSFTNFVSCIVPDKKCSRANIYYPRIYDIRLSRVSCIPSGQLIICYGRRWQKYNNDFAYDDTN